VTYHELVFGGHGIDCPVVEGESLYQAIGRCCPGFFEPKSCNQVYELLSSGLGWGRHKEDEEAKDVYYSDMSEAFAFHHFTPSMMMSSEIHQQGSNAIQQAMSLNRSIAEALTAVPEPTTGIAWASKVIFRSPKYTFATLMLTRLFTRMQLRNEAGLVDFIEVGGGFGSVPRLLTAARKGLRQEGFDVRSYSIFDLPSIINLQRWYLKKTLTTDVEIRDWHSSAPHKVLGEERGNWGRKASERGGAAGRLWPEVTGSQTLHGELKPLRVDLVDPDHRDLFAHLFGAAHAAEADQSPPKRPARVLLAVNSWHEFVLEDFLWYYNHFVAAPSWQMGVDWIVYVSNRAWVQNDAKEALLLESRPQYGFEIDEEDCNEKTCFRILRRQTHPMTS